MKLKFVATLAVMAFAATPALAQFTDATSIIGSIGKNQFMRAAGKVDGATSARVVRLSTFMGASSARSRLDRAEDTYARRLAYLRGNLMLNPFAMQAIRAAGFSVDDIVALTLDSDGSAILYADDL